MKDDSRTTKNTADRKTSNRVSQLLKGECKDDRAEVRQLLKNIKATLPQLRRLLRKSNDHWTYEDGIYRFYHQSFKVFNLQAVTLEILKMIKSLAPPGWRGTFGSTAKTKRVAEESTALNTWFLDIVKRGTGRTFRMSDNDRWQKVARPILEAFFHARYFLQMIVKYGQEIMEPPAMLPSGWASVLYLYNMR